MFVDVHVKCRYGTFSCHYLFSSSHVNVGPSLNIHAYILLILRSCLVSYMYITFLCQFRCVCAFRDIRLSNGPIGLWSQRSRLQCWVRKKNNHAIYFLVHVVCTEIEAKLYVFWIFYTTCTELSFMLFSYRLAPEHTAPAAFEDCLAVTKHIISHAEALNVDVQRLGIMGKMLFTS